MRKEFERRHTAVAADPAAVMPVVHSGTGFAYRTRIRSRFPIHAAGRAS